jgi:hypothetical protein
MGAMECAVLDDKSLWDAFVAASPQGNIFCHTVLLDALPDLYEAFVLMEDGRIVLGALILRRDSQVLKAPYPMTMYQGVLCCGEYQQMPFHRRSRWLLERMALFLAELDKRYSRLSFCLFHQFEDLRAFQWLHFHEPQLGMFRIDLRYTGILCLQGIADFETYLTQVRTVRRQEYRRALADGFTIESSSEIDLLNQLHAKTFERQGIVRGAEEERLLLSIAVAALDKGFGEMLICRDKLGNPASATLFLHDRRYGYYLVGANHPEYRKANTGTLLLMENIRRCQQKGLAAVDFVGINSPDRGDFKTSFNARPVPYYIVDYVKPA